MHLAVFPCLHCIWTEYCGVLLAGRQCIDDKACIAGVENKVEGKQSMLLMMSQLEEDAEVFAQKRLITLVGMLDLNLPFKLPAVLPHVLSRQNCRGTWLEPIGIMWQVRRLITFL
jgi:hypothetical protein